ncbi:MAG: Type secretory pathway, protease TraF [Pseudomonadota bacterium]|jgi:type IV secretory pathway protease TraF
MDRRSTLAWGLLGVLALGVPMAAPLAPQLVWNATASAPEGLYRLHADRPLAVGDWAALRASQPLAGWLHRRGYLPDGVLLIKKVAARAPSRVCRQEDAITVDGRLVASAASRDRVGRLLPVWRGCFVLGEHDLFLLNPAAGSLDSRYFGALPDAAVVGRAEPLWLIQDPRHGR